MSTILRISVGDRVRLKKAHPCGSAEWEVLRTGADVKIKCLGCGRLVLLPRLQFERRVRQLTGKNAGPTRPDDKEAPPCRSLK
jgi:hypothetical protein